MDKEITSAAHRYRWVVLIVGFALTLGLVVHSERASGVYLAQVNVIFLLPPYVNRNTLQETTDSVISVAGVVGIEANAGQTQYQTASDNVTLVDAGVRHGYSVRLPNFGGQWATNFNQPVLDVQTVAGSATEAATMMRALLRRVSTILTALQPGVPDSQLITTRLNPADPSLYYESGSRSRSVLASLALGLSLTIGAVPAMDRLFRRRRRAVAALTDRLAGDRLRANEDGAVVATRRVSR